MNSSDVENKLLEKIREAKEAQIFYENKKNVIRNSFRSLELEFSCFMRLQEIDISLENKLNSLRIQLAKLRDE